MAEDRADAAERRAATMDQVRAQICDQAGAHSLADMLAKLRAAHADRDRWRAKAEDFASKAGVALDQRNTARDRADAAAQAAADAQRETLAVREQLERLRVDNAGNMADLREMQGKLTEAQGRVAWLTRTLARLVALKDGPRDGAYRANKPIAWQQARDAIRRLEQAPPARSERDA